MGRTSAEQGKAGQEEESRFGGKVRIPTPEESDVRMLFFKGSEALNLGEAKAESSNGDRRGKEKRSGRDRNGKRAARAIGLEHKKHQYVATDQVRTNRDEGNEHYT